MSAIKDTVRAKISKKRIPADIKQICESKEFLTVMAETNNMNVLWVKFHNKQGFYRNQTHVLEIKLNTSAHDYPFSAPHVKFLTPCFHTNVNGESICLSILKGKTSENPEGWTETYNLCSVVQAIFLLLECPNTGSPYNSDASRAWTECKQGKLEASYVEIIDKYYFSQNYQGAIDAFDRRFNEDHVIDIDLIQEKIKEILNL